jgi:hypothetical protein
VAIKQASACTPTISGVQVDGQATNTIIAGTSGWVSVYGTCLGGATGFSLSGSNNVTFGNIQYTADGQVNVFFADNPNNPTPSWNYQLSIHTINGTNAYSNNADMYIVKISLQSLAFTNSVPYSRDCVGVATPWPITSPTWPAPAGANITCPQAGFAGDHVVYVAGSSMHATATFSVDVALANQQAVTGVYVEDDTIGAGTFRTSPGSTVTIPAGSTNPLGSTTFSADVIVDTAFPAGQTKALLPLQINWFIAQTGTDCALAEPACASVGTSANPVYVTLAQNLLPSGWDVMLTYAALAVGQGGATSPAAAVAQTWGQFASGLGPAGVTTWNGSKELRYYPQGVGFESCATGPVALLTTNNANGQCGSFAYLLLAALATNGIPMNGSPSFPSAPALFTGVCPIDNSTINSAMLIKNWQFGTPSYPPSQAPYTYAFAMASGLEMVPPPQGQGTVKFGDLTNQSGLAGQNSNGTWVPPYTPSEKFFNSHYIVKLPDSVAGAVPGGPYLDPSYGAVYADAADFQSQAVAGYGRPDPNVPYNGQNFAHWVIRTPSGPASVGLVTDQPQSATLSAPANGATGVPVTTTLSWADGSNVVRDYVVWISTDPSFPSPGSAFARVPVAAASGFPVPNLTHGTTYYWKVVAENCLASAAASQVWSFTTAP